MQSYVIICFNCLLNIFFFSTTALASHTLVRTGEGCNGTLVCTFPIATGTDRESQTWKNASSGQLLKGVNVLIHECKIYEEWFLLMLTLCLEKLDYATK